MHYSFELSVSPVNTAASPAVQVLHMGAGILNTVDIEFPAGCAKLVRFALYDGATQILPSNMGGFYAMDDNTAHAHVWYDLDEKYNELIAVGWTIGTVYTHTVTVMLEVQGPGEHNLGSMVEMVSTVLNRLIDLLKGMF